MPGFKRVKIKICLLGDPAVGKTSLIQKYIYNFFGETYMRTLGTKVSRKVVQYKDPKANMEYELIFMIWDIMGQKFSSMPLDKYLQLAQGALIVCDITREETFNSLSDWRKTLYKETGKVPVVCLANKIDLEKNAAIKISEFEDFCKGKDLENFLTSAKTGKNVNEAFLALGKLIIQSQADSEVLSKVTEVPEKEPGLTLPAGFEIEEKSIVEVVDATTGPSMTASEPKTSEQVAKVPKVPKVTRDTEIKPGMSYIIKEEKPHRSFQIFRDLTKKNIRGLCITRTHPNRIREEYKINDIPILWLSADSQKNENIVVPTFLPQLNTLIIDFIQKHNDVVIILEGIEYLIDQNDFKAVLRLVHSLNDYIMGSNARLLIPLDPLILGERELHILTRDFKIL